MSAHRLSLRVYFEDTDASGIMYHARYLAFFERGRTEMLRGLGIDHAGMLALPAPERLYFVVRRIGIDYRQPARLDDLVTIESRTLACHGASLRVGQTMWRGDEVLAQAEILVAMVGADGRAKRLPADMRRLFRATMSGQTTAAQSDSAIMDPS